MNQLFSAGIFAAIIGMWNNIKSFVIGFYSLFIRTDILAPQYATDTPYFFHRFLTENGWKLSFKAMSAYIFAYKYNYKKKTRELVGWKHADILNGSHLYYKGRQVIWVEYSTPVKIKSFRFVFDTEELAKGYNNFRNLLNLKRKNKENCGIYMESHYGSNSKESRGERGGLRNLKVPQGGEGTAVTPSGGGDNSYSEFRHILDQNEAVPFTHTLEELEYVRESRGLDTVSLSAEGESVCREVARWYKSQEWYRDRDITWKKGLGLYGPPGTGKTSLVRAIGHEHGMNIHTLFLAGMTDEDFVEIWDNIVQQAGIKGTIILLEDFDAIFEGRVNKKATATNPGVGFDTLINKIDGIEGFGGILLVVTTNKIESLDPALTRPGRIDHMLYMGPLDESGRRRIATKILSDTPEVIEEFVKNGEGETGAVFQERCRSYALEEYWKRPH